MPIDKNEHGVTRSLTFYNKKTEVETDCFFDKAEEISSKIPQFDMDKFDYQVIFDVDEHLYKRIKFQQKVSEAKEFYIKNDNEKISLCFDYGTGPDGEIIIKNHHKNEVLNRNEVWRYPLGVVAKILLHVGKCFICFSKNGHLRIVCRTGYARYSYVVPANTI